MDFDLRRGAAFAKAAVPALATARDSNSLRAKLVMKPHAKKGFGGCLHPTLTIKPLIYSDKFLTIHWDKNYARFS
jgi:hypothetical protein